MVDLTEKYVGTPWKDQTGAIMNPNYAFLINEMNNFDTFVLQGGTRSGKTWGVLMDCWRHMDMYSGINASIVRQSMPVLKGSIIPDFVSIGTRAGLYSKSFHNQTDQIYRHDGNELRFVAADSEEKLRGRKQDYLYVNEAPELTWPSVQQLLFRTTGKKIFDYNPSYPESWLYDEILTRDNVAFIRTTYKDNPHLSPTQVEEIERLKYSDPHAYLVFGLGQRGEVQGAIYSHFQKIARDQMPPSPKIFVVDFGFSPDPTAIIRGEIRGRDQYAETIFYDTVTTNTDIMIHLFFGGYYEGSDHVLIADSAEPKDIYDLRNPARFERDWVMDRIDAINEKSRKWNEQHSVAIREGKKNARGIYAFRGQEHFERFWKHMQGLTVIGAIKGPGSIRSGIKAVKSKEVFVPEGDVLWTEYGKYKYKRDRHTGLYTNEPVDKDNHAMDCLRYMALAEGRYFA